jgi:hypothetical protein
MAVKVFEIFCITIGVKRFHAAKIAIFMKNTRYSIEKPKYFKKGVAHGFISYLCSKINELNLINKL